MRGTCRRRWRPGCRRRENRRAAAWLPPSWAGRRPRRPRPHSPSGRRSRRPATPRWARRAWSAAVSGSAGTGGAAKPRATTTPPWPPPAAGSTPLDRRRREFYARLAAAFGFLEEQVRAGRLRAYGVSSNTAARPASDPEATSLTRMLEAAREAGGAGHHFRVLQLPLNLFESGAVLERSDGPDGKQTVLDVAPAAGAGVLVNRPPNAMVDEGLRPLASL